MSLEVGSRLGRYDVTALIGEGGMGQVYQATDTKLNLRFKPPLKGCVMKWRLAIGVLMSSVFALTAPAPLVAGQAPAPVVAACEALAEIPNLTLISAQVAKTREDRVSYCYVRGILPPAIGFHIQLPLPENWNGRFLNWGDGGPDGDLDFADHRVAEGYAVANSNTGHDNGAEPGWSFAFDNRQAEIDFGYRAVHLTVNAGKRVVEAYYGQSPTYSYHEGCSTGGRQALMEAQRYPEDLDGIVAGAPVNFLTSLGVAQVWLLQHLYRNDFEGNLAFDTDDDGSMESLTKFYLLQDAVLAKCDAKDGITDGVLDNPLACDFDPRSDLATHMCRGDINGDDCFTTAQVETIEVLYEGATDNRGRRIYKGKALGSEFDWPGWLLPHAENSNIPLSLRLAHDRLNYGFYETDPGVAVQDPADLSRSPDKRRDPPEWAWWEFDINDVTAGKGDLMMSIFDATDPDLSQFLLESDGKLIIYHGWGDAGPQPEPTLDYYQDVVATTFGGDIEEARNHARLFMVPGMGHCSGGPGPNTWDKLAPLVAWVEQGVAPEFIVATHATEDGVVDNERRICAHPERAVYTGPAGGANDPANWVESNFSCQSN